MRIGKIIGSVTLSRWHPTMSGARYRIVEPYTLAMLTGGQAEASDSVVVYDDLNPGEGDWIAFSEGGEAAQPFRPDNKPVDAYNAAILDAIDLDPLAVTDRR